jgi:alkanesulfonate monooxygenase SsuD/methylene tetrahydromethanopterin reductase-like flavin-dependent oxidoreductase (luciferase family)
VAATTEKIRLAANVHSLPMRDPAVHARAVASLDILSGGRIELGIGAGGFWDAIEAMGGPRRSPGEAVDALEEALDVFEGIWDVGDRSRLELDGGHYRLSGAKRGPAPAHQVRIWIGGYKPRMLDLIGRRADGWLPTFSYLDPAQISSQNAAIDRAATAIGRKPSDVRRLVNISTGEAAPDRMADLATRAGFSTFILATDDPDTIARFGEHVSHETRTLVDDFRGTNYE